MNVQQFNTGSPVSLWTYFAIALPLTIFSLLAVHLYGSIKAGDCQIFDSLRYAVWIVGGGLWEFLLKISQKFRRWVADDE